ncbi:MAG: hypothetical protein NC905_06005 [Candidatus Omnitrophica bacterium]|nr:hypothetical protein [Candidatus Omnitrophota bacterium]MCM8777796.1 hypothetical protein [Candidatus Omnitrophota bacterium]
MAIKFFPAFLLYHFSGFLTNFMDLTIGGQVLLFASQSIRNGKRGSKEFHQQSIFI